MGAGVVAAFSGSFAGPVAAGSSLMTGSLVEDECSVIDDWLVPTNGYAHVGVPDAGAEATDFGPVVAASFV